MASFDTIQIAFYVVLTVAGIGTLLAMAVAVDALHRHCAGSHRVRPAAPRPVRPRLAFHH
jgi:hypothetical protein